MAIVIIFEQICENWPPYSYWHIFNFLLNIVKYSGRFRGARGAVAPHLPSQDIQKDRCVVIKTY